MPFEKMLAHKALDAIISREMPKSVPIQPDEPNLAAGANLYREHCAVCHGLPDQRETFIAKGMYPHPPKLTEGKGVTDDEPGESYWKAVVPVLGSFREQRYYRYHHAEEECF